LSWLKRIANFFVYKGESDSLNVATKHENILESNNEKWINDVESSKTYNKIDQAESNEQLNVNTYQITKYDEKDLWSFIDEEDKFEDIIEINLSEIICLIMNERNSIIICTRLGLVDSEPKTLQEIGDEFGITRERIRQIEAMFYRRLRYYSSKDSTEVYSKIKDLVSLLSIWISPEDNENPFYVGSLLQKISKMHYLRLIMTLFYDSKESEQKEKEYRSIIKGTLLMQKTLLKENNNQKVKFDKLFKDVAWPETTRKVDTAKLQLVKPKRLINRDNGQITGEFFSQKNKRNIEYESNIEYKFCMHLESLNEVEGYVQQPVKIPYSINGLQKNYYPDFLVIFKDGRCLLVEIKPRFHMVQYQNMLKYIALQKYCISKGYGYLIAENYHSINKLVNHEIDNTKLEELNKKVEEHPINWLQFKPMMNDLSLTQFESNALILHGDLMLTTAPYKITISDVSFQEFIKLHKCMTADTFKNIRKEEGIIIVKPAKINKEKIAEKNQVRGKPLNDYSRWAKEEDQILMKRYKDGMTLEQLSLIHQRGETAINTRLTKLTLEDVKREKSNTKIANTGKDLSRPNNSHSKWTTEEEDLLTKNFNLGMSIKQIAEIHERKEGGIRARLVKLGLIEKND